uniref:UV-stimulated scaffold protein A n=1 Tax=Lates calcarifer TaxID=8187 RepID=A0A4W6E474_LATCA
MELSQRERLSELVEQLTTSGQPQLNQDKMKEIKKICRYVSLDHLYHLVMNQLNQEHCEIRLSAFQIASELFSRSHHFRNAEFLELTVETDSEQPLPPPKEVARKLRSLAIQTVQSWQASYGTSYKKLALGYHFLKQVKKVDFQDAEARTVAERRREEERQRRMERIYKERVEAASRDMEGKHHIIQQHCCQEISYFALVLNDWLIRYQEFLNLLHHVICFPFPFLLSGLQVKETEDNEAVVSTVRDLHRLITTKHLPAVQGWVQVFTKAGAEEQLVRRALDLKRSLEAALQKHEELHIDYKTRVRKVMKASSNGEEDDDDDDGDDDFDDVPEKEGYEPHIPEHLRAEYGLDPSPSTSAAPVTRKPPAKRPAAPPPRSSSSSSSSTSRRLKRIIEEEQDPTCAAATLRLIRQNLPLSSSDPASSQSSSDQKPADAPVVPFGLDLYYWGQEQPNAGKIIKAASQHQFWVPIEVEEEVENEQLLAESKSRYISFPGRFTPVSHYCRAPLGNGKLCQRQDRLKCPFHGQIVPRDQEGRPCRQEDRLREEQEERRKREEQPDWRDAELMRDIEAATGENLGSDRVGKKGKGKKKKFPNLSDLKQSANTSRCRLEKKVFNKSAMRRVAQVMAKADRRKHDKFSNQFNYSLN